MELSAISPEPEALDWESSLMWVMARAIHSMAIFCSSVVTQILYHLMKGGITISL
jgi:hypothetical protein